MVEWNQVLMAMGLSSAKLTVAKGDKRPINTFDSRGNAGGEDCLCLTHLNPLFKSIQ